LLDSYLCVLEAMAFFSFLTGTILFRAALGLDGSANASLFFFAAPCFRCALGFNF
jgi:hypothetical protein